MSGLACTLARPLGRKRLAFLSAVRAYGVLGGDDLDKVNSSPTAFARRRDWLLSNAYLEWSDEFSGCVRLTERGARALDDVVGLSDGSP